MAAEHLPYPRADAFGSIENGLGALIPTPKWAEIRTSLNQAAVMVAMAYEAALKL